MWNAGQSTSADTSTYLSPLQGSPFLDTPNIPGLTPGAKNLSPLRGSLPGGV
jgi:hypothetical protein